MAASLADLREAGDPTTVPDRISLLCRHPDVRVRVLCAKHPRLALPSIRSLARDAQPPVRRVLAHRNDLPPDVVEFLAADKDAKTRSVTIRRHELAPQQVLRLIEAGNGTPLLFDRLREAVAADPAFAELVLLRSNWWYLASHGSFRRGVVRRALRDTPQFKLVAVAAYASLTTPALLAFSRHPDRQILELLAQRKSLTKAQRLALAVCGRPWLAAALLVESPTSRSLRAVAFCRRGHIITRARAATGLRPSQLWRLSFRDEWGTAVALASNPHIGQRTVKRLVKLAADKWWAVGAALAQRTDLAPGVLTQLPWHPAVQLFLAANPNTPLEHLQRLVKLGGDPFVSQLASVHPAMPSADRAALATNGETPAWLMRRLANDSNLAPSIREQALTWLALGGAIGDPDFDPISGTGTPGGADETHAAAYGVQRTRFGTQSSLWRARMLVGAGVQHQLSIDTLQTLAEDYNPDVRRIAAGYDFGPTVRSLRRDPAHVVSGRAATTAVRTNLRGGAGAVLENLKAFVPAAVLVAVLLLRVAMQSSSEPETGQVRRPLPGESGEPIVLAKLGRWSPGPVATPADEPVCQSGGTTVWVAFGAADVTVTVRAAAPMQATVRLVDLPTLYVPSEEMSFYVGSVRAFTQPTAGLGTVEVAIGESPSRSMVLRLGVDEEFIIRDEGGDC